MIYKDLSNHPLMITTTQIKEIRSFLEKSKKPLFIFDNDPDGLTSYLLLKKRYLKGERLCLKASQKTEGMVIVAAVKRHKPDLVVFLDVPTLEQDLINQINTKIVWIDHHPPLERENVHYYNPRNGKKPDNRPTSYWAYQVADENVWLAVVGIVADWFVPDAKTLKKFKYKKLLGSVKNKTPPQLIFDTEYGKLVKAWYFCMKGTNEEMNECLDALEQIESPLEIFDQTTRNGKIVYQRYTKVKKDYDKLLQEALSQEHENVFICRYPGDKLSYRSILSNELIYRLKSNVIIIATEKEGEVVMSLRSKGDKPIASVLKKALEVFKGYGGGHDHACGGAVSKDDFPKFVEFVKTAYKK